jgi:uncharacterized protein (DUF433 family)
MNWRDCVTDNLVVMVGKPVLKGTRLSVEFMAGLIAQGWPEDQPLRNHHISRHQLRACAAHVQARASGAGAL